jgi:hypothetical protein
MSATENWVEVRRRLVHGRVKRCGEMMVCGEWEIQEVLRENGQVIDIRERIENTPAVDVGRFTGTTGNELAYLFRLWEMAQQALELHVIEEAGRHYDLAPNGEVRLPKAS